MNEVSFDEPGSPSQCFLQWCRRTVQVSFTLGGGSTRYSCKQHKKKFLDGNAAVSFGDAPAVKEATLTSEPVELPEVTEDE